MVVTDSLGCTWSESVNIQETTSNTTTVQYVDAFRLFPNPAETVIYLDLELKKALPVKAEIWNSAGNRVLERRLGRAAVHNESWDLSHLAAGLYLMRLEIEGDWISRRFVKVN